MGVCKVVLISRNKGDKLMKAFYSVFATFMQIQNKNAKNAVENVSVDLNQLSNF